MHRIVPFMLAIIAIFPNTLRAQPEPSGSYNIAINERPSAPYPPLPNYNSDLSSSGRGPSFTVEVSRHHIIPFNVLRDFFNTVANNNDIRNLQGFLQRFSLNMNRYASRAGVDCAQGVGVDIQRASNISWFMSTGQIIAGGMRFLNGLETFAEFYAWLPGNLFIGPRNRVDDPGDGFEVNARGIVGENFYLYENLDRDMRAYIRNPTRQLLIRISSRLSQLAQIVSVYRLKKDDWEFVHGQYRLKRVNQALRKQALWEKVDTEFKNSNLSHLTEQCSRYGPRYGAYPIGPIHILLFDGVPQ